MASPGLIPGFSFSRIDFEDDQFDLSQEASDEATALSGLCFVWCWG